MRFLETVSEKHLFLNRNSYLQVTVEPFLDANQEMLVYTNEGFSVQKVATREPLSHTELAREDGFTFFLQNVLYKNQPNNEKTVFKLDKDKLAVGLRWEQKLLIFEKQSFYDYLHFLDENRAFLPIDYSYINVHLQLLLSNGQSTVLENKVVEELTELLNLKNGKFDKSTESLNDIENRLQEYYMNDLLVREIWFPLMYYTLMVIVTTIAMESEIVIKPKSGTTTDFECFVQIKDPHSGEFSYVDLRHQVIKYLFEFNFHTLSLADIALQKIKNITEGNLISFKLGDDENLPF